MKESNKKVQKSSESYENVPKTLENATISALENSIGHLIENRKVKFLEPNKKHISARFWFNYPEIPHVENGDLKGWLPPYRCREKVESELRTKLPSGYSFEQENNYVTVIFRD